MKCKSPIRPLVVLGYLFFSLAATAQRATQTAQPNPKFEFEFTNPKLTPPHWVIQLNPDGSGQFEAAAGTSSDQTGTVAGEVQRPIQLSLSFTARVFNVARERRLFAFDCESHLKVAMQGMKRLSYSGPDGTGSCTYNYSRDKEIQALGDSLLAVGNTLMYGARLENLLQHDRLGLDQEMTDLCTAVQDGNAIELVVIRETLLRIANDDQVLDRARRRARKLLGEAG
jgi:hypothetical protein